MIRRPPRSTRTDTLFPYTTLFRSYATFAARHRNMVPVVNIQCRGIVWMTQQCALVLATRQDRHIVHPRVHRTKRASTDQIGLRPVLGYGLPQEWHVVEQIGRRQRSEEHKSELPSLMRIPYAVLC